MKTTDLPARMPLNEMSWQGIKKVAAAGQADKYWAVGDTKTIILDGEVKGLRFDRMPIDVFILDFRRIGAYAHIYFGIGMKDGKVTALCSHYGKQLDPSGFGFCMNRDDTNMGGWEKSYMRTTFLGADQDPAAPAEGTFLSALPRALREVMCPVTNHTDNSDDMFIGDPNAVVTRTRDILWLPAEYELGDDAFANICESRNQLAYAYFKEHGVHPYMHNAPEKPAVIWTRSRVYSLAYGFISFRDDESCMAHSNLCCGITPCFAV